MIQKKNAKTLSLVLGLFFLLGNFSFAFSQPSHFTNSLGMEFVLIPAGSFVMGCNPVIEICLDNEMPQHTTKISEPFYIGKYEISQSQWEEVMGDNPSKFKKRDNPVENVSWNDIQTFIRKLNLRDGSGQYRLPTEAEWEYAARAGSSTLYFYGDEPNLLTDYAWYKGNSQERAQSVGKKSPNPWGLHDMHGNVWEWVADRFGDYLAKEALDPQGPAEGEFRVIRGGSWNVPEYLCRSAVRHGLPAKDRNDDLGFRLAFFPKGEAGTNSSGGR